MRKHTPVPDLPTRFWAKVDRRGPDECWPWLCKNAGHDGRGRISFQGRVFTAPRVAWFLQSGEWPPEHLFVCHTCDNPPCCNLAHFFLGTASDNAIDAGRKGRLGMQKYPERSFFSTAAGKTSRARGERNTNAKLTEAAVREIRRLRSEEGLTYAEIGKRIGVSLATAHKIAVGQAWVHVK